MDVSPIIPDIAQRSTEAPTVTPLAPATGQTQEQANEPSFMDQLKGLLSDTNDKLNSSSEAVKELAMGKRNDLDNVVTSMEEANLALSYTIAIRGKLLDAYNEVARITV